MNPQSIDWKKWLTIFLVSLATSMGGSVGYNAVCTPGACPCCKPADAGKDGKAEPAKPAECCPKKCCDGKCCKVDKIEAREIVLTAPGSNRKIILTVNETTAGIWLHGEKNRVVCFVDQPHYTAVGLYKDHQKGDGFNAALAVGEFGDTGLFQLTDGKLYDIFGAGEIASSLPKGFGMVVVPPPEFMADKCCKDCGKK